MANSENISLIFKHIKKFGLVAFNPIKHRLMQEAETGKYSDSKIVGLLKVTSEVEERT